MGWNSIHPRFRAVGGADVKGPGRTEEFQREFQGWTDGDHVHGVGGKGIMEELHRTYGIIGKLSKKRGKWRGG